MGWYPELSKHFILKRPKSAFPTWTRELCLEKAATCDSYTDFDRAHPSGVRAAKRHGWLEEIMTTFNWSRGKAGRKFGYFNPQRPKNAHRLAVVNV